MKSSKQAPITGIVKKSSLSAEQDAAMIFVSEVYQRELKNEYYNALANLDALYYLVQHYPGLPLITESLRKLTKGDSCLDKAVAELPEDKNLCEKTIKEVWNQATDKPLAAAVSDLAGLGAWLNHHPEFSLIAGAIRDIIDGYYGLVAIDYISNE